MLVELLYSSSTSKFNCSGSIKVFLLYFPYEVLYFWVAQSSPCLLNHFLFMLFPAHTPQRLSIAYNKI